MHSHPSLVQPQALGLPRSHPRPPTQGTSRGDLNMPPHLQASAPLSMPTTRESALLALLEFRLDPQNLYTEPCPHRCPQDLSCPVLEKATEIPAMMVTRPPGPSQEVHRAGRLSQGPHPGTLTLDMTWVSIPRRTPFLGHALSTCLLQQTPQLIPTSSQH